MIPRPLLAALVCGALLAALATAVVMADTNIPWSVSGAGGGTASSAGYALGGTAGQPVAGSAQSASYALGAGYWAGIADADSDGILDDADPDDDGDGYMDVDEASIGTNRAYPCGTAGWPSNLIDPASFPANHLDVFDVTSFLAPERRLDTNLGAVKDNKRWDLVPGTGPFTTDLNIQDLTALFSGSSGFPPMFNSALAYDRTCPLPP
jgi:hypothetical protein